MKSNRHLVKIAHKSNCSISKKADETVIYTEHNIDDIHEVKNFSRSLFDTY